HAGPRPLGSPAEEPGVRGLGRGLESRDGPATVTGRQHHRRPGVRNSIPHDPATGARTPNGGTAMDGLLLSTADTDLLAARASGAPWRIGNPGRLPAEALDRKSVV